ncbi:DUF2142 domain-containing protein [Nocardioides sp. STR3]|uniref:DUF2142 domain-containing protein n=2 Tax=Nocardioides pinisoli TaxID=2950279 RepID=A0ABT1KTU3_9ACTN|nr:DUF2142 domain-containing protein [Nocardioides pinisoli]
MLRGADEIEHVKKASGISTGEFLSAAVPVEGDIVEVQRDVCLLLHDGFDLAACEPVEASPSEESEHSSTELMNTTAALSNPVWYVVVAPASWLLDGAATVWGIRAIGAVICALLITWAVILNSTIRAPHRSSQCGVMLCLTPAVIYASTVAAPNGVHMASALLLWVALLTTDDHRHNAWAICVAGATMSVTHTLGLFWLTCAVASLALLRGRRHVLSLGRNLVKSPAALAILVATILFALSWIAAVRPNDPTRGGGDPLAESTKDIPAIAHGVVWIIQLVGTMPYRFNFLWFIVYGLWFVVFAVFLARSLQRAEGRERLTMAAVTTVGVIIPIAVTILTYEVHGYAWQGRYELPLLFAVPLIAASVRQTPGPRDFKWAAAQEVATGLAMGLGATCLAVATDSGPALAVCAGILAPLGWWMMWESSHASTMSDARRRPAAWSRDQDSSTVPP